MLNPFQKSNLKIAKPGEYSKGFDKTKPEDKPAIIECFESVMGTDQRLRRSGRAMMARCPFHGENNPSFAMYEDTNSGYCFTCGWSGDSYKFLMDQLNCDFKAAKQYAEEHNLYVI